MKLRRLLVHVALAAAFAQAHAQTARSIRDEYANVLGAAQTLTAYGPNLFGESVNLKDGVTSFSATDVAVRTNSGLPLALTRTLGINAADIDDYVNKVADGELFGNWKLDVPMIHGTFDERTGWVVSSATPNQRCSSGFSPPGVKSAFTNWNITYTPEQYWHGNEISIPGQGSYPLLALPADRTRPANGETYVGTTKGDWRVSCVPTLKNGPGEGFKVSLPDGTRYTFDWLSSRKVAALKDKQCKTAFYNDLNVVNWSYSYYEFDWSSGGSPYDVNAHWRLNRMDGGSLSGASRQVNFCREETVVNRREYFLQATKVEDRFGNTIVYDYDPAQPRRLRSITSSDGTSIAVSYGSNGKISAVSHGGRTWQYQYASADGAALSAVVQPDTSRWTFQYGDLYSLLHHDNQRILWADCEPAVPGQATAAVTIGHPSGAVGVFNFRSMMHGTDRVPGGCYQPDPDQSLFAALSDLVMVYKTASLTSKQVSGPGLAPQTWQYAYFPAWSWNATGYVDDCSFAAANCDSTVATEVTAPDGTVTRSTFGNDYWHNAGQLLKVETLSNGNVVQSVSNTYLASAAGQPFPDTAGVDPNARNNRLVTEKIRPLTASIVARDGDVFSRSVQSFDSYARPVRVVRSNSLGYQREEVSEYHDNPALWVMGQVRRQYVTSTDINATGNNGNVVVAETEFDARAMPWKTYAFGKLQQTLTYTPAGNVATATDGNGNTTELYDYARGIPRSVLFPPTPESPAGSSIAAEIDANGWIIATVDELGSRTCYSYDAMGRNTGVTYPSETQAGVCDASRWSPLSVTFEQVAADEYGLAAGHWRVRRSEGNLRVNTYLDAQWRPVLEETFDAANAGSTRTQTIRRFDALGRPEFVSFPQRGISSFLDAVPGTRTRFDALNRKSRVDVDSELSASVPLTTTLQYLNGLRLRVTDPRGLATTTSYLAWDEPQYGLPLYSSMPEGKIVQIERQPKFGWPLVLTQKSADGTLEQRRRYVYDGNAQLCKSIEPENGSTVVGYDGVGNVSWSAAGLRGGTFDDSGACSHAEAWSSGRRVQRTYDARNRLQTLSFADAQGDQSWSYTPDGLPARISAADASAGGGGAYSTSYSYNKRRLLTSEVLREANQSEWAVGYAYDGVGHLASHTYPTGLTISYAPNALGQPTQAGSYARNAQYYPNGALQQFTFGNGLVYSMAQNTRQMPGRISTSGVSDHIYSYDANGNVLSVSGFGPAGQAFWSMNYDGLDRLVAAESSGFGGNGQQRFSYDALDNLKSWKLGGVKDYADYRYDPATHRLTTIRDSAGAVVHSLGYDTQGNVTSKNGQSYVFDIGNRLRSVAGKESYRYDAFGRRLRTTGTDGRTTAWHYTQAGQLLFWSDWQAPGLSNQKTHENVFLGGRLVATIDHQWPSNAVLATKYQHTDALGSPVAATNEAGQVVDRNDFEPYGAVVGNAAYRGMGFTGHVMDGGTGLTYMQQRYYDPAIGRFLSVDPVPAMAGNGRHFNRYAYGFNNPYRYVDPDGRDGQQRDPMVDMTIRQTQDGVTETVLNGFVLDGRTPDEIGQVVVYGNGRVIDRSAPGGMAGRTRNPQWGNYSPKQAEFIGRKQAARDFQIVSYTARISLKTMEYIGGGKLLKDFAKLAALGKLGPMSGTYRKAAQASAFALTVHGIKEVRDEIRYVQNLGTPIEVPTDAEIDQIRAAEAAQFDALNTLDEVAGKVDTVFDILK